MLDRSKCKKYLVWDIEKAAAVERVVIDFPLMGGCLCVAQAYEDDFLSGGMYETSSYYHFEEIKEPEYVPFETLEDFMPYIDCWFRIKGESHMRKIVSVDFNCSKPIMFTECALYNTKQLWETFEMYHNNEWIPVGKLDAK